MRLGRSSYQISVAYTELGTLLQQQQLIEKLYCAKFETLSEGHYQPQMMKTPTL
jgi:hypothetical protein